MAGSLPVREDAMRRGVKYVAAIVLLGALCAGCTSKQDGPKNDEMISSAKMLDDLLVKAFNKGDAEELAATYWNSPDLVVYPPGEMEYRGWPAAHDAFVQVIKKNPGAQMQLIEPQYLVAGDYVIGNGRWKVTFVNGQEMLGRYTEVMAIKNGKWVYVRNHYSEPLPPPRRTQPIL